MKKIFIFVIFLFSPLFVVNPSYSGNEIKDAEEARKELVRMANKARKMTK